MEFLNVHLPTRNCSGISAGQSDHGIQAGEERGGHKSTPPFLFGLRIQQLYSVPVEALYTSLILIFQNTHQFQRWSCSPHSCLSHQRWVTLINGHQLIMGRQWAGRTMWTERRTQSPHISFLPGALFKRYIRYNRAENPALSACLTSKDGIPSGEIPLFIL